MKVADDITNELLADKATISDFAEICELFKLAAEYYKNKGIKQWEKGYDLVKIHQNISKGEIFVIRNESRFLLGTFAISHELPNYYPEYLRRNNNIWLLQSLCTNLQKPSLIVRKVLPLIIKIATKNEIEKIYLDCVMDNPILECYYQRYGFRRIAITEHPRYEQNMVIMVYDVSIFSHFQHSLNQQLIH
ncbi:hypothetical protein [Nostoc sp. FACHB-280]|uniref:hypothetical protein n=1 Tax=Nostoc sp. FACHB-280 TaxID=2692839 RepID=UPI00168AE324|nr:hypothetical protein [Nostoc sp. FACHB-280]MBD2498167.1 hypothetical protein [Nostoc sp. FACHB-280]